MKFKSACKILVMAGFLSVLTGCGSTYYIFAPVDTAHTIKPARLAVISGGKSVLDKNLALALTEELEKRTSFQVLTQEEIGKKLKKYPVQIETIEPEGPEKPVCFSPGEKKTLDAIQAQLKADYLFVIWGGDLTHYSSQYDSSYSARILGNMLEYPKGKVVTLTDFYSSRNVRFWEVFRSADSFVDDIVKNSAEWITDEFLEVTKAAKVVAAAHSK